MVEKNIWFDEERKLYYVNLDYGKDKAGKRIRKTETFLKKKDAKSRLIEFEADKLKGSMVAPDKTTFGEWLDYWMKNVIKLNREETTYAGYEYIINRVKPALGDILLQKLTAMDIQLYLTDLQVPDSNNKGKKSKLSSNTAKKHYVLIKTALNYAVKQKVLINNPANNVESPKYVKPDIAFYTPDQLRVLLEKTQDHSILYVVVCLASLLGLRREEICGLRWENINLDKKVLYIKKARVVAKTQILTKDTKSENSKRTLAISEYLIYALRKHREIQKRNREEFGAMYNETDYIVTNELGSPIHPGYLSKMFTKFIRENGLAHITLHGLRHTMATIGNDQGITLYEISKILGHSDVATTSNIYTHVFDATYENGINTIGKAIHG